VQSPSHSPRTLYPTHPATHHYPPLLQWISPISPIRNPIIHPLLACSPLQCDPSDPLPILIKDKCTLLAFVMCLLRRHPFCSLNIDLCHHPPEYWSQTDRSNKMRLIQPLHSSRATEIFLTKYEKRGCPEQSEYTELLWCVLARTSISALRRQCNIWASSFLK